MTVFVITLPMYRHERWAEGGRRGETRAGPATPQHKARAAGYAAAEITSYGSDGRGPDTLPSGGVARCGPPAAGLGRGRCAE